MNPAARNSPSSFITSQPLAPNHFLNKFRTCRTFHDQKNISNLTRYLGFIHYYHCFIPKYAERLYPLHQLTHGQKPSDHIAWTPSAVQVFNISRNILASSTLLTHPPHNALTRLTIDTSDQAVSGMLEQLQAGKWVPVAFFSKSLHKAESRYSAFDRELLALYLAIKHFHYFLEGHSFSLPTLTTSL